MPGSQSIDIPELVGKTIADARVGGMPYGIKLTMVDGTVALVSPRVEWQDPVAVSELVVYDGEGKVKTTRRVTWND